MVKRLEAGGLTLEQSLELWERGERLAAVCGEWLDGARARLAAAMAKRDDADPAEAEAEETRLLTCLARDVCLPSGGASARAGKARRAR